MVSDGLLNRLMEELLGQIAKGAGGSQVQTLIQVLNKEDDDWALFVDGDICVLCVCDMVGWWWEFGVWGAGRVRRQVQTLIQARHLITPNRRSAPSPARWATASAATWGRWCPSSCGTWATPSTCLVYIYIMCVCVGGMGW